MPRKGHVQKREILPDPMYNSKLVTSLIDHLMIDGKRGTATKILYAAFDEIKNETGNDPVEVFQQAMENVMPVLEVKARRVGGSNYQVPIEVRPDRRTTLGLRWIVQYARLRGEHTMVNVLHVKSSMLQTILELQLKSVKIRTVWQKPTVHSHTTAGNNHCHLILVI
ncbi:ribosomal protein S7 [Limosilactobacillus reuteri subsp. rodentium]|uniref:Ribosomal protein S7 n=1 Tax=Limosilactobacillus reuteri subsp. rodentium (strain DSM 17509 / CIP 109821 / 100-23) TaxID=349123 RepID=B3XPL2_LIMR1|nr:ribosomal protein S7 [Limosilactobacillus reuteri subsp. rodentium]